MTDIMETSYRLHVFNCMQAVDSIAGHQAAMIENEIENWARAATAWRERTELTSGSSGMHDGKLFLRKVEKHGRSLCFLLKTMSRTSTCEQRGTFPKL